MSKAGTFRQLIELLVEKKLWWLVPMVVVFSLLGLLLILTYASPSLSPFIYALF
ncbi:MAG: hypothetical protein GX589_06010 [Deltaproteobacteria bacterium]|nr:hypothetical protein [Deltaproteobacteria bacterium]